jgi:hypothetical protein
LVLRRPFFIHAPKQTLDFGLNVPLKDPNGCLDFDAKRTIIDKFLWRYLGMKLTNDEQNELLQIP